MFSDKQEGEEELVGAKTLYRELGYFQIHKLQYLRSLAALDKAIELTPNDRRTLIGRSWARSKVIMYTPALADIDKGLLLNPGDLMIMQQKALLTYFPCEFEDALIQNIRGIPKRKCPKWFVIGAMQCAEAIERSIGKRGGHALRDHYDIIRKIAWKKALDLRKGYQPKPQFKKTKKKPKKKEATPLMYKVKTSEPSILESLTDTSNNKYEIAYKAKSPYQPPQPRTTNIHNVMAEKYLEEMCYDKKLLKTLRNDPRLECPNFSSTQKIKEEAKYGYKTLSYRQESLRTRLPFYSIKYREGIAKGLLLLRQEANLRKLQAVAQNIAEGLIKQLREAREAHLTNDCIEIAEKAKTYIDKKPLKVLPEKENYLKQLYELIGLAHLDCYRLNADSAEWNTTKRITFMFGLPISRDPSQDSVIEENKDIFMNVKKAIRETEERMSKATSPLELIWFYYTLARFNIDLNKWDLGRFYARKCINMAQMINNDVWATNGSMLITRAHILQRNRNEAKDELIKTLAYARNLKNKNIIPYITKCIEVFDTFDFGELSGKAIEEREKAIISAMMGTSLKENVKVLFQRMAALPGNRKMAIMPGIVLEDDPGKQRLSKSMINRPSIKPHPMTPSAEVLSPNYHKLKQDILAVAD